MKVTRLLAPLLVALPMAAGCVADDAIDSQEDFSKESEILTTYNGDLSLIGSYNELFDKAGDTPCVRYEDGAQHARVTEPTRDLSIDMVKKKEDLAQKLGVDLNMKARYATVSGNATVSLLNEYTSATNAVTYLLTARTDYVVRDQIKEGQSIVLTDAGKAALSQGPAEFYRQCGTHYIDAVRYGARFYLMITYKANSHSSKTQMDATLGIDGALMGSGDVKTRLERAANVAGVSVTIKGASNGFWLDSKPAAELVKTLASAQINENMFVAATQLYFSMVAQVENEYCLDSGDGSCKGATSPGYFARNERDAAVTGVQLGGYHNLANAQWEGSENPFQVIKDRVEVTRRFIRNWSELEIRMDNIYSDEIKPFLESAPKDKALFNIAPPGKALRTPMEVFEVAKTIEEQIYPPTGGVMGWYREDIQDRIVACMNKVNIDVTSSCTESDELFEGKDASGELEADDTKQWNELYKFFDDYHATKRILPLHVAYGTKAVTYGNAQGHCDYLAKQLNKTLSEQGSSNKVVYRLAKGVEVKSLAPVLGYGNVQWTDSDIPHATWFSPGNGMGICSPDYPYYQNEPASTFAGSGCAVNDYWDDDLIPICVPASGPIPLMAPQ
jgi:hypothetical protein